MGVHYQNGIIFEYFIAAACSVAGFDVSGAEHFGSTTRNLVTHYCGLCISVEMLLNQYLKSV